MTELRERPSLVVARAELEAMWRAARAAPGLEICGLLLGCRTAEGFAVAQALVAANVAAEPQTRFEIDPALLAARQRADRAAAPREPRTIGVFHSHPAGGCRPSPADLSGMAATPDWAWLILGQHGQAAAWISAAGQARRLVLVVGSGDAR